ncbi:MULTISPECIES: hypothetical protein [Paenibacillus]|uniref:Uncharacterized protein n=1 Tax=Paenibacillus naphthalenovorans TaxID=162209 RepID=A0A0U2MTJ1_9BACL|nr:MULTISPECIES: hypothetical protein [Paenibacillus]ALS20543.1 hypothetical protein IJ22_01510 [Paenibacillus naphthalenovorans]GCL73100.1 hypothetical protein PN4B1_30360 [Paenibacillus naphthalenovorans]SDI67632.1 hypothetical protein SAMN05421868_10941 [Paenibacillus naphthalenovorans]
MPLNWSLVKQKYGKGAQVPTVAGRKTLQVTGVDDEQIYIRTPLWTSAVKRSHLEEGVRLIEEGVISRDPGLFVEDYRVYIVDDRATSAAHILHDLGFLDEDTGFTSRSAWC